MPRRTSPADPTPVRVAIVTMDPHLASAVARAQLALRREYPGITLELHAAAEWNEDPQSLERCRAAIAAADVIVASMLFMEDHYEPVLADLERARERCDALVCIMSAPPVARLTRMGSFKTAGGTSGPMALLKRLRGQGKDKAGKPAGGTAGAQQMRMLRRVPKLLRFIPGTAQDVRAYLLTLSYWLAGSEDNMVNMVKMLLSRYASGPRETLRRNAQAQAPVEYPETGLYHPRLPGRIGAEVSALPNAKAPVGTVGVLVLRSYVLAGNTGHYDGAIAALEARGLRVIPAFAAGLDARPAIDAFFKRDGVPTIDALVSLTGFSLVGGPAYNDAQAAEDVLASLDVPYVAGHPVEFQTLEQWGESERGLLPVESTIMIAIPELDGATGPIPFGGRAAGGGQCRGCSRNCHFEPSVSGRDMHSCSERAEMLAARVQRLVQLRRADRAERKVAVVLFSFPPNAGTNGTAAHLAVFESLHATLGALSSAGYTVDTPASVDALREQIIGGNATRLGAPANVHARIQASDHVRRERWLKEIESAWGPAPGKQLSDGGSIWVLGARFGNVFVGIQPAFGYEGDPMRLLFEKGFAPTHAFSAFYRWIREDFGAHAVLHFGTHGALEFMPGKQAGLSGDCWPDRLIGDLPNVYLYASNNPSEGTLAKRRAAATTVSYLTPPIAHAGLYKGLLELKGSLDRWRALDPADAERISLAALVQAQAAAVELTPAAPAWSAAEADATIPGLSMRLIELEYTLIPHGLHVVGRACTTEERIDLLEARARTLTDTSDADFLTRELLGQLAAGASSAALLAAPHAGSDAQAKLIQDLEEMNRQLSVDHELPALLHALDGGFIRPAPGGDVLRTPEVLPTGRNIHGFDPFRLPSPAAMHDGILQSERLLKRVREDGQALPESIALVLWGTDNLKSEGSPIAQALALMGARPRFDPYGRLAGATLVPLAELGRPRIDVLMTISGIFRDLLPLQSRLLAEAAFLAASAEEPAESNFVRKHALAYAATHGCDLETAALRVFGNADGAYGANVNHLIESGRWHEEDEIAETYSRRKCFAYGRSGRPVQQAKLLQSALRDVALTYQNLDSLEVGVTTVDTYFDTLGGISRAVRRAKGGTEAPVYLGDQTQGQGTVRTLAEQVALETRTRTLNPKWYEGMLAHGYEGVRQLEAHVTNTFALSATTGAVAPWVYEKIARTFVLDDDMRRRLATLNATASAKVANRLIEAHERKYWQPDAATLDALRRAGEELEDRLEGVFEEAAA